MSWRGKLSQVVQELRIHCCQYSPSSTATREFIQRNYSDLKALNPTLPILVRECSGVQPRLWARYDFGVERSFVLDGLTEHEINVKLEEIVKQGRPMRVNLLKLQFHLNLGLRDFSVNNLAADLILCTLAPK